MQRSFHIACLGNRNCLQFQVAKSQINVQTNISNLKSTLSLTIVNEYYFFKLLALPSVLQGLTSIVISLTCIFPGFTYKPRKTT
jgi:hypothetical protein